MQTVCPKCKTLNPLSNTLCGTCGASLDSARVVREVGSSSPAPAPAMICRHCGASNPLQSTRCSRCGKGLARGREPAKAFTTPLAVGLTIATVIAVYNSSHSTVAFLLDFALWWAIAAFGGWLTRPSWRRAAPVGVAVLLYGSVFGLQLRALADLCSGSLEQVWLAAYLQRVEEANKDNDAFARATYGGDITPLVESAHARYVSQLQVSPPRCLATMQRLASSEFYYQWKGFEALTGGDYDQAEALILKSIEARQSAVEEIDRLAGQEASEK